MNSLLTKASAALTMALSISACTSPATIDDLSAVTHVHGLVIHDGRILAGTHEGVFVAEDDNSWSLVGEPFDVMGLAEVDGELFASGHPGPDFDFPDPLGLLSSSDGGASWEARSLTGEVDFHLLEGSGETLIGVAANLNVLVKSDDAGANWVSLEVPALSDIALDPDNPSSMVLVNEEGAHFSEDGGSSFRLVATKIRPAKINWSAGGLFAATPEAVWRWDEAGQEWQPVETGFKDIRALASSADQIALLEGSSLRTVAVPAG